MRSPGPHAGVSFTREEEFPARLKLLRWIGRQTWIPRGRHFLLRAFCNPNTCDHFGFEVDFFGQRYRGDLAHWIDWQVFYYGSASYPELSLLRALAGRIRNIRPEISFYDVGANTGQHSLFMSAIADRVIAFEPSQELRELISARIELNQCANITVVPFALGEKDEHRDYFAARGRNSGIGTFLPGGESRNTTYSPPRSLSIRQGDLLFEERSFPRVDLMKVDVEGFEPFVFRGLRRTIRRDRPAILTEIGDTSRVGFGSESAFRACFYEDATIAEVEGQAGREFRLAPFCFEKSKEAIIVPPEFAPLLL